MKNNFRILNKGRENNMKNKNVRALRLGVIVSKMETFADIKEGRFRRIFNRHLKPYGI
jgi:hypothetical protein